MKKHIRAFVSLLGAAALALGCASCGGAAHSTGKSGAVFCASQPWEMAFMGQVSAQEPQSRQEPALIS